MRHLRRPLSFLLAAVMILSIFHMNSAVSYASEELAEAETGTEETITQQNSDVPEEETDPVLSEITEEEAPAQTEPVQIPAEQEQAIADADPVPEEDALTSTPEETENVSQALQQDQPEPEVEPTEREQDKPIELVPVEVEKETEPEPEEEIAYNREEIKGDLTQDDITVSVIAPCGAFPEGTRLVIEPIYDAQQTILDELEDISGDTPVIAFDITFQDPKTGKELQPAAGHAVSVSFEIADRTDAGLGQVTGTELMVVHLDDKDRVEEMETEVSVDHDVYTVEFEAESFSVYGVIKVTNNTNGGAYELQEDETARLVSAFREDGVTHTWTSSDETIATVAPDSDYTAIVTGVAEGRVTITDTCSNGNVTEFLVNVGVNPTPGCTVTDSGMFGDGLLWIVETDHTGKQILRIRGEGEIPNQTNGTQPWSSYRATVQKIVIEDGISAVGDYAFCGCTAVESITTGKDVKKIGRYAFAGNTAGSVTTQLKELNLNDGLEQIGLGAFAQCPSLTQLHLPDTVQVINNNAFTRVGYSGVLHLPRDLTSLAVNWLNSNTTVTGFEISPENEHFATQDGILYTKDKTQVIRCPAGYPNSTVVLPENCIAIGASAFSGCTKISQIQGIENVEVFGLDAMNNTAIQELHIKKYTGESYSFRYMYSLRKVTIDEYTPTGSAYKFYADYSLEEINLPLDCAITTLETMTFYSASQLKSFTLTENVRTVNANAFNACTGLSELILRSKNLTLFHQDALNNFAAQNGLDLLVGTQVETLSLSTMNAISGVGLNHIHFEGENWLTIQDLTSGQNIPKPFSGLTAGNYYVDANGVLYRVYNDHAQLVFVPDDLTEYTVPATVTDKNGVSVPVTSVGNDALAMADTLERLDFADPASIDSISPYAFTGCETLCSLNGCDNVDDAKASFSCPSEDTAYAETGLLGSMPLPESDRTGQRIYDGIVLERDGMKLQLETKDSDQDYYTGQSVRTIASFDGQPTNDEMVARVYVEFSQPGGQGDYNPGTSFADGYATYYATDVPNVYYYKLDYRPGSTVGVNINNIYPSPATGGGTARVWGTILTKAEDEALGHAVAGEENDYHEVRWITQTSGIQVTKELYAGKRGNIIPSNTPYANGTVNDVIYRITPSPATQTGSLGVDNIRYLEFTDVVQLPAGGNFFWNPEIVQQVQDQASTLRQRGEMMNQNFYAQVNGEEINFLRIYSNPGKQVDADLSFNENGDLVIHWMIATTSPSDTAATGTLLIYIFDNMILLNEYDATESILNTVDVTAGYNYSDELSTATDSVSHIPNKPQNNMTFSKVTNTPSNQSYYGEDVTHVITMNNKMIAPQENVTYAHDDLNTYYYIKPENMERMFAEDADHQLRITITSANFCAMTSPRTVTAMDGSTQLTIDAQTTGTANNYIGSEDNYTDADHISRGQIVVEWNEDQLVCRFDKDSDGVFETTLPVAGASLQSILSGSGFMVDGNTRYTADWIMGTEEEPYTVPAGEIKTFRIYSTVKDTFMQQGYDKLNRATLESFSYQNSAQLYFTAASKKARLTANALKKTFSQEYGLWKNAYLNGDALTDDFTVMPGEVVTYGLRIVHSGKSVTKVLPVVDKMEGAQILLAPVDSNPALSGLPVYEYAGQPYYKLSQPGTYHNVCIGKWYADTITVEGTSNGLTTLIKMYAGNYGGGNSVEEVKYKVLVDTQETDAPITGGSFRLKNTSWLNDHMSHRLFAPIGGRGTVLDFAKEIVESKGTTPGEDILNQEDVSTVREGECVTYRLRLTNEGDYPLNVTGAQIYDILPESKPAFSWSGGNVHISYARSADDITVTSPDDWSIVMSEDITQPNEQWIKWGDEFLISFQTASSVYIYVTLDYPSGAEWTDYFEQLGGRSFLNTLIVNNTPDAVTHNPFTQARPVVQKGVYETGRYTGSLEGPIANYKATPDFGREVFATSAAEVSSVTYYVSVYNAGFTKLYLTDLVDTLPENFRFHHIDTSTSTMGQMVGGVVPVSSKAAVAGNLPDGSRFASVTDTIVPDLNVEYMSAVISKDAGEQDNQIVFKIRGSDTSDGHQLGYDEQLDLYYLVHGQAVVFGYTCLVTGDSVPENTQARNSVAMEFLDTTHCGIENTDAWLSKVDIQANASNLLAPNDGEKEVDTQTGILSSSVDLISRKPEPDVKKDISYKLNTSTGLQTDDPSFAAGGDRLGWTSTFYNNGDAPLTHWTVEDVMDAPYYFISDVVLEAYNADGSVAFTTRTNPQIAFSISGTGSNSLGEYVQFRTVPKSYGTTYFDGGPRDTLIRIYRSGNSGFSADVPAQISFFREEGNKGFRIAYDGGLDSALAIPAGGYMTMTAITQNATTPYYDRVYHNTVRLLSDELTQEEYNSLRPASGTKIKDDGGAYIGLQDTAQITISSSFHTESVLSVTENGVSPENKAVSDGVKKSILLGEAENSFTYHMSVTNTTDFAMDKLVMLNNLPDTGDKVTMSEIDRGSEYKVSFADQTPVVTVTLADGTSFTLDGEYYTIEYSEKDSFNQTDISGVQNDDWHPAPTAQDRSIRFVFLEDAGTQVPPDATVTVSFAAKAEGTPGSTQTAWDTFSYSYSLFEIATELQSAPEKVGVTVPTTPTLQKELSYYGNRSWIAEEDVSCRILIYRGNQSVASGLSELTESALTDLLTVQGIPFTIYQITVNEGQSISAQLDTKKAGWTWESYIDTSGQRVGYDYTLVEVDPGAGMHYLSAGLKTVSDTNALFIFQYDPASEQLLTVTNSPDQYELTVHKLDGNTNEPMSGAVFGIYSQDEHDQAKTAPAAGISAKDSLVYQGTEFHLIGTVTTGADGNGTLGHLRGDRYLVVELVSPPGYSLAEPVLAVKSLDGDGKFQPVTVTVTDYRVTDLSISKTVQGNMGNKTTPFSFTLTLSNETWMPPQIGYTKGGETGSIALGADGVVEFTLTHGETITLSGIPLNTVYTVSESDDRYETTIQVSDQQTQGKTVNGVLTDNPLTVAYTNTLRQRIPTGADFQSYTPIFLLAAQPALGFGLCVIDTGRRRRNHRRG